MTWNYSLWAAIGPGNLPFWLCLIGALALAFRRPSVGLRFTGAGLLLFILLAILPTGFWLMRPLEMRYSKPDYSGLAPPAIIVLAGGEALPASALRGEPEFNSAPERLLTGIALARRFPEAQLYLVGGITLPDGTRDTDVMLRTALGVGFERQRIRIISDTRNTCENARAATAQLGRSTLRRSILITSAYHLPRAMLCFEAVNASITPVPVDYKTWPLSSPIDSFKLAPLDNLEQVDRALHEWVGLLYYRVTGRTLRVWPAK
ncbi:MAG TPA: YdcF family protein [Pedomonas sp.]|uniref:YdcF family protein n=1 Tax=Pedomonas sp. TaxID=2976421 RepID=UPI002F40F716